jgi:hypothetical protein
MGNNDDNWLEGAFLAQEEYDRDKDKWKGNRKEMESHFFSQYDTLPDTSNDRPARYSSSSSIDGVWIVIVAVLGIAFFCFILAMASG